jgi:amidophosphoribosyltransferase
MDTRDQLVGANFTVEEIRNHIGATSLGYLSNEAMVAATGRPKDHLCRACFDGDYPIGGSSEKFALENRTHFAGTRSG